MSALTDSFDECLDAAQDEKGTRETVTFRGNDIDAIFYDNPEDRVPGAGGDAEDATLQISIKKAGIATPVNAGEKITIRGKVLDVIMANIVEARIDITAGDFADQQRD